MALAVWNMLGGSTLGLETRSFPLLDAHLPAARGAEPMSRFLKESGVN